MLGRRSCGPGAPSHESIIAPCLVLSGSHTDLAKGNAPHYKAAVKHYSALADKAVSCNHVIDIFACSLDQVMRREDQGVGMIDLVAGSRRESEAGRVVYSDRAGVHPPSLLWWIWSFIYRLV